MGAFKRILVYAEEYKNKIYLAAFLIFLSVIMGIIPYLITNDIIVNFMTNGEISLGYLMLMSCGVVVSLFLQSFLYFRGLSASHKAAFDTLMGIRVRFADKMTKLPLGDITAKGTGSYKKNFVDDIEAIEALIAHFIPEGIPYVIVPIIVFIILFAIDWRLALLAMASIPVGTMAMAIMLKTGKSRMRAYYQSAQKMNSIIVEYVSGMEVIKIFNRTAKSFEKYTSSVENYKKYTLAWVKDSWTYMAIYGAVLPCTVILLLPVGTLFYINGTLSLPTFVFSLMLTMSLSLPLVRLVEFFPLIPILSYKIEQLENTFSGEELKTAATSAVVDGHDVAFHNVTFAYNQQEVIKDVSFVAKENNVTAIVGESGSGKSTLARLLVHYWDVKEGQISVGGVNINQLPFAKLMDLISYVSQDTFLFNDSIMENIRIGKPDATDEEIIEVAKLARCHDFIVKMPDGYHTKVGDSGNKLSGGEKQRITIARAIIKNAPIIVLDEATAATDLENEDKIQEALNKLIVGKTLIVIAHRLSTIVEADNIIVMKAGQVVMQGSHQQLLEKSAEYQTLWNAHIQSVNWDIVVKEEQNA